MNKMEIGLVLYRENFSSKERENIQKNFSSVVFTETEEILVINDFIKNSYGETISAITIFIKFSDLKKFSINRLFDLISLLIQSYYIKVNLIN